MFHGGEIAWIGFIVGFALLLFWLLKKENSTVKVFRTFRLSQRDYLLVGSDLGRGRSGFHVRSRYFYGTPDSVFRSRDKIKIIVGEVKGRLHRGIVRFDEFYQITMYMGCLKEKEPLLDVMGRLVYKDKIVEVSFNQDVYRSLVKLEPEVRAFENSSIRKKMKFVPLHERNGFPLVSIRGSRLVAM